MKCQNLREHARCEISRGIVQVIKQHDLSSLGVYGTTGWGKYTRTRTKSDRTRGDPFSFVFENENKKNIVSTNREDGP